MYLEKIRAQWNFWQHVESLLKKIFLLIKVLLKSW